MSCIRTLAMPPQATAEKVEGLHSLITPTLGCLGSHGVPAPLKGQNMAQNGFSKR